MRSTTKSPPSRFWRTAWFLACVGALARCGALEPPAGPPPVDQAVTRQFGMYSFGASGVAALPDGRVIIAEDERRHPLVAVDLFAAGTAHEFAESDIKSAFRRTGADALNDLEAITIDRRGRLYATTSHAVPRDGKQTDDRTWLVRFEVTGDALTNTSATASLGRALGELDAQLFEAIGRKVKTSDPAPGLSIEGLAWDPRTDRLLVGLRAPLRDGHSLVVSVDNPDEVFDIGARPKLSGPFQLDLDAQGIRDFTYDAELGGFVIVAGASGLSAYGHAEVWLWSGPGGSTAMKLRTPVLDDLKPEGVAALTVAGQRLLLFACDDGWLDGDFYGGRARINKGIPSHYAILPIAVLRADNPSLPPAPGRDHR